MDVNTRLTRRALLRHGATGGLLIGAGRWAGLSGAAASVWLDEPALATHPSTTRLVVIFLRGGADGLHLLAPTSDAHYAALRGPLGLAGGIPLVRVGRKDARRDSPSFRLHPAFEPASSLVEAGRLAAVHMAGSPNPTRSHFDAQDHMESGLADRNAAAAGWLARALGPTSGEDDAPFERLALGANLPLTLRGSGGLAIDDPADFGLPRASRSARSALLAAYSGEGEDPVGRAGRRALAAIASFERRVDTTESRPQRRQRGKSSLETAARGLERFVAAGLPVHAAFLESDGWDSHRGQGADTGQVAGRIEDLARALAVLAAPMPDGRSAHIVVLSEFGRTVRANGSGGSDHGHGGVMLVVGPGVQGGVHGRWTGLDPENLYEGRDLPVHTDFRSVLSEVLSAHRGARVPAETFPGFTASPLGLFG
jgi:uncharacterized protein (DUF1501 family)